MDEIIHVTAEWLSLTIKSKPDQPVQIDRLPDSHEVVIRSPLPEPLVLKREGQPTVYLDFQTVEIRFPVAVIRELYDQLPPDFH